MQILIVGGDMRHTHLAALARARGHDVQLLGHHETTLSDARPASEIVMPFPRSEEDGLAPAPFSREALPIAAVAELILPGARVLAARPGPLLQKCLQDRRCVHKDPNDVESFQLRNAVPSAEGALYALLGRSGACLCGKTCLLTGYGRIARALALRLRAAFEKKGWPLLYDSPTNQQFPIVPDAQLAKLAEKYSFSDWARVDETHRAVRFCTSWATKPADVDALIADIEAL